MKKKNLAMAALAAITLSCVGLALAGCGETESYYNLSESGTIYYEGEQTVKLSISEYTENKTTFKDSITKDDITLSGVLEGKTVKDVSYVSETEVSLVLDGAVTANSTQADDYGTITVASNAMANNAAANCITRVNFNPSISVIDNSHVTIAGIVNCSSTFQLPYGSFISENVNTDNIVVPADDVEVTTTVTDAGNLKITVNNYLPEADENGNVYNYPVAKISANVTTFNTDLYVYIGIGSYYGIKSTPATADGDDDRYVTDGNTTYTNGLEFKSSDNGETYYVSKYTKGNTSVVIPDTYNNKPVTAIAEGVFKDRKDIKSVQLGANIETIEANAFNGCTKLKKVLTADGGRSFESLKTIGDYAFYNTVLTVIGLPSVTAIGESAFEGTQLKSIELPAIQTLGAGAFSYCTSLETVTLSNSLTEIPDITFNGCSSLTSVYGVSNVTYIGNSAFFDCGNLVSFGKENVISLSENMTDIGDYVFKNCKNIKTFEGGSENVVVLNGVLHRKNVDSTLTLLTYPAKKTDTEYTTDSNVSTIFERAFSYATNLKKLTLSDSVTDIGTNILGVSANLDEKTESCSGVSTLIIGDGLTSIGAKAFMNTNSLNEVVIGDSVKTISERSFTFCFKLKKVTMGENVETIGISAFYDCKALGYIKISDSVKNIYPSAFFGSGLKVVDLGSGVQTLGYMSFAGCSSLQYIIIGSDDDDDPALTKIENYFNYNCSSLKAIIYCGYEYDWKNNVTKVKGWNSVSASVICKANYYEEEDDEYNADYFKYKAALKSAQDIVDSLQPAAQ
jgi:hypothetical protein